MSQTPNLEIPTTPRQNISFGLRYRDAHAAIAWLERAFGFTTQALYQDENGVVEHAQLTLGNGLVMIGSLARGGQWAPLLAQPDQVEGRETILPYLLVADATATHQSASAAGAEILHPLTEMPYGGKAFGCRDPEGHLWSIGEYDPWQSSQQ